MNKDPSARASSHLSRRKVFAGVGAAGALAAVAATLPTTPQAPVSPRGEPADAADRGGYQVTEHVLRYYQTAKV
jgi:hypothetical protein